MISQIDSANSIHIMLFIVFFLSLIKKNIPTLAQTICEISVLSEVEVSFNQHFYLASKFKPCNSFA